LGIVAKTTIPTIRDMSNSQKKDANSFWKGFWPSMALLVVILAFLFRDSFKTGFAHAANDGPLGLLMSKSLAVPGSLTGYWVDLNWVGMNGSTAPTSITYLILWALGPIGFAKFYPPLTLLLLGASAWIFFRTLKLSSGLCCVMALAAALNMNFFSNTCWGLGTRALTLMSAFLALSALNTRRAGNPWLNAALAGFCVGLGIIEGADNGAIFSLFIGAYVVFQAFVEETTLRRRLISSLRLGVVGLCAALLAAQVLITLTGIASKTARGAQASPVAVAAPLSVEQKKEEEQKQWLFATMWSLRPREMLRLIIPGIYGYRMDTPDGGEYWGRVGEYWGLPEGAQRRNTRSSGAGEYAGMLVALVGLWAFFHSCRRGEGPKLVFTQGERRYIWFWSGMLLVGMIFSWGYHAPFYRIVYSLPYFSTIRNPMKFMHPGHMALMILFGYGLLGLSRRYLETVLSETGSISGRFNQWRKTAMPIERRWFQFSIAMAVIGVIGFLSYSNARGALVRHLQEIGFPDEAHASAIARFSMGETGKALLFLVASLAVVTLIQIGVFSGRRSKWAVILMGGLLTLDLARADLPWIKHYDYRAQYTSNPVIDALAKEPWLHRAAVFPNGMIQQREAANQIGLANQLWRGPWLQYLCQYYNVQSLDMPQDPRPSSEKTNFMAHTTNPITRLWELTNTRYILGLGGSFAEVLNQQLDPVRRSFRLHTAFDLPGLRDGSGGLQPATNTSGPWALVEFGAALPRASLYTDWQVVTDDTRSLEILGNPSFDPHKVLIVNEPVPPAFVASSNATPGTVEFVSYAPKHVVLKVNASVPSMLLLNDQFDRDWRVTISGEPSPKLPESPRPAPILRCNYLMRGVPVPAGASTVVFHFQPSLTGMKVTLAAFVIGLLMCGFLFVSKPHFADPAAG
jgi:hypothetical protein